MVDLDQKLVKNLQPAAHSSDLTHVTKTTLMFDQMSTNDRGLWIISHPVGERSSIT